MSDYRFVLYPGYVISRVDGDRHFINGSRLAALYGVDVRDCVYGDNPGYRPREHDIHLYPRSKGDYPLLVCGSKEAARDFLVKNKFEGGRG